MRHSMKPDLRADYKIRLYTGPKTPFFEVSSLDNSLYDPFIQPAVISHLNGLILAIGWLYSLPRSVRYTHRL